MLNSLTVSIKNSNWVLHYVAREKTSYRFLKSVCSAGNTSSKWHMLENIKTGFVDFPILDRRNKVVYDRPYQIPEYVIKFVNKHFDTAYCSTFKS